MKTKGTVLWMVRLLLISRIVIVLLALAFALILWQKSTHNLITSVEKLSSENPNIDLLERGITTLYQAENNFRFYSATYDRECYDAYSENLHTVYNIIDTLQNSLNNSGNVTRIDASLNQKVDISNIVIRLKMLTDSLLAVAGQWDTTASHKAQIPVFDIRKIQNFQNKSTVDSIFDTATIQKKGFFKKVKSLFKDEGTPQKKGISVKRTEESKDTLIETNIKGTPEYALLQDIHSYYSNKINSYTDGRSRLNMNEKILASINAQLIDEIVKILQQVKQSELDNSKSIKDDAILSGEKSARQISIIAAISMLLAAIFFFIVIYYLGKIKESSAKLESEKLRAENLAMQKSSFISTLSREIRSPLNNVIGFSEQLKETHAENHENYLSAISTSAEQMSNALNQIFDFSLLEEGKMKFSSTTFSPYKAIEAAGGTLINKAKAKKLMLNLHLPTKEDILVSGDEKRLKQVITNLIDNAIELTEKGEINLHANVSPQGNGYRLFVEIADSGKGIPADELNNLFKGSEKSGDLDKNQEKYGTGLALIISKKIIDLLDGKIYIKKASEKGTVFALEIPYSKPTAEMARKSTGSAELKIPSGKTILLADDDALSILLISKICKKHNINVITADNGQVAYNLALKNKIDLILTDIRMPMLEGHDFVKKIRITPEIAAIPVIAVTASLMDEDETQLTDAGFNEILFKPFKEKDLIEKISLFLH